MIRTLPCCGHEVNSVTELKAGSTHVLPKKGDLTICYNCGSWYRYTTPHTVRPFIAADLADFKPETIDHMRRTTRIIKRRGRLGKKDE